MVSISLFSKVQSSCYFLRFLDDDYWSLSETRTVVLLNYNTYAQYKEIKSFLK